MGRGGCGMEGWGGAACITSRCPLKLPGGWQISAVWPWIRLCRVRLYRRSRLSIYLQHTSCQSTHELSPARAEVHIITAAAVIYLFIVFLPPTISSLHPFILISNNKVSQNNKPGIGKLFVNVMIFFLFFFYSCWCATSMTNRTVSVFFFFSRYFKNSCFMPAAYFKQVRTRT